MRRLLKNFSLSFSANIISLVVSTLITFIAPIYLDGIGYGYYQLYAFYIVYIAYLHFGLVDGIILRHGGEEYENLPKGIFNKQFKYYFIMQIFFSLCVIASSFFYLNQLERLIVIFCVGISIVFYLPRLYFQGIFQATNRIKEFSVQLILEKLIMVLFTIFSIVFKHYNFLSFIIGDLIGKAISLIYSLYICREMVFHKFYVDKSQLKQEIKDNYSVGWKMTLSLMAGNVIIGIVRLAIENKWDIETFGKVSLTLTVSNLFMVAIRSIAVILFPFLRRIDSKHFSDIYSSLQKILTVLMFIGFSFYYPIEFVLVKILPQYSEALKYMAILFPLCVFECKLSLLIETYLKTLRKEKELLAINCITVLISFILSMITVFLLGNLNLAIFSILFLCGFRCILGEIVVGKIIKLNVLRDIIIELIMSFAFIIFNWFIGGVKGVFLYILVLCIYFLFDFKFIKCNVKQLLILMKEI